jgi:L-lactate dehydrogenase complex protein LldG
MRATHPLPAATSLQSTSKYLCDFYHRHSGTIPADGEQTFLFKESCMEQSAMVERFRAKAEAVSAVVSEVETMAEAVAYTVDLCVHKEACQILVSGCDESLSPVGRDLCGLKEWGKIIAAPGIDAATRELLVARAKENGISVIENGLREHLGGVDIGFTVCQYGIAETGTLVLDSVSEEVRLATMLGEIHVAVLPKNRIAPTAESIADDLRRMLGRNPNYLALITGASRTADIERVLALGVHGPLELHILLVEEA